MPRRTWPATPAPSAADVRHAVVLAGGLGTRLWPLSTARRPKQLAPLADGRSLLDLAAERAAAVAGDNVWLATGQSLLDAAGGAVAGFAPARVIVEPSGRDTLAAVCLAMATISAVEDAILSRARQLRIADSKL